jgi:REP element-mobilizing transposase RayT
MIDRNPKPPQASVPEKKEPLGKMRTVGAGLSQHQRGYLVHLERGGATYFLTFHAANRMVLSPGDRAIVLDSIKYGHPERWFLHGAVVMPDHAHMLCTPAEIEGRWLSISEIVKGIKSVSARKINHLRGRRGSVWMDEYYDRTVRDDEDYFVKIEYMKKNPVKAGLAARWEQWDAIWINDKL